MKISVASWNLCGLGKLVCWPATVEWLTNHDVFMIQGSLQVTPTFPFIDVKRFDVPAFRVLFVLVVRSNFETNFLTCIYVIFLQVVFQFFFFCDFVILLL
jgi:hypothetical protein